ncbi:50S ribosomal protein L29 [Candidatus Poriferisodalis sp.]|uniref:50S ribosomal protein L29 n=1 Tax=Candidatus Poriferisodalis sp. TaxID=3101277 RepID=UPI003B025A86
MAKAATLRTLSDDQLLDELDSAKKELFNLRFAFATGQLDNSAQVASTKRDIARIHTVLREREIAAADLQAGAPQGSAAGLAGASQGSAADSAASTGDES